MAADPEEAVHRAFRLRGDVLRVGDIDYFLSRFMRIFVVGAGKAAGRMALAVERVLGRMISGGLVITQRGQPARLKNILVREAGHPLPDEDGARATEEMLELVEPLTDRDLVICVLSGGGSALLEAPLEGLSVPDLQRATRLFLASGMTIHEINTVRKHLSRVKGGRLAERIHPATVIALILSDVIGDQVEVIASGPAAADPSTFADAVRVLQARGLWDQVPGPVRETLAAGERAEIPETPKEGAEFFKKVHHRIIGSNRLSIEAAEQKAHRLGMNTLVLSTSVSGESREVAHFYAALAREVRAFNRPVRAPACFIAGGETTVTVKGEGQGGRCQELALAVALELPEVSGAVFLAAGTDGVDGPTDAAGALADSSTVSRAAGLGLSPQDHLQRNDSHCPVSKTRRPRPHRSHRHQRHGRPPPPGRLKLFRPPSCPRRRVDI